MISLLLTVVLHAEPMLQRSLDRAVAVPGGRAELLRWQAPGCRGTYEVPTLDASGRVPVRVRGPGCEAWGWATVRVLAPGLSLIHDVAPGQSLLGAWSSGELEVRRGRTTLTSLDPTATAARALRAGQPLTPDAVRLGPAPGTPLTVRIVLGGLVLEQQGRAAGCGPGLVCATLPSGRKVQGALDQGVLIVSAEGARP